MLKLFLVFLFPNLCLAYPELLSRSCTSCHSETSGSGILTSPGKDFALNSAHQKSVNYFEIDSPDWLLLGAKADLKQTFTETPYEKAGSFKATRVEAQLGLSHAIDTYLNVSAQGSVNRVEPTLKSDSISDYVYSPYRFIEFSYSDNSEESLAAKHGLYRNEWQNDLALFETSFEQSEIIYSHSKHQLSLGYITKTKTYNTSTSMDDGFINYKFFEINRYSITLGHQWHDQFQLSSLGLVAKKSEGLTFKALLAQTTASGIKGLQARIMPIYQLNSFLKLYALAEYQNSNIKISQPRTIIYGLGSDYLWFAQGLLSLVYLQTDNSALVNNPTQKLELTFHLYM
jgi:hypothetical protein